MSIDAVGKGTLKLRNVLRLMVVCPKRKQLVLPTIQTSVKFREFVEKYLH